MPLVNMLSGLQNKETTKMFDYITEKDLNDPSRVQAINARLWKAQQDEWMLNAALIAVKQGIENKQAQ